MDPCAQPGTHVQHLSRPPSGLLFPLKDQTADPSLQIPALTPASPEAAAPHDRASPHNGVCRRPPPPAEDLKMGGFPAQRQTGRVQTPCLFRIPPVFRCEPPVQIPAGFSQYTVFPVRSVPPKALRRAGSVNRDADRPVPALPRPESALLPGSCTPGSSSGSPAKSKPAVYARLSAGGQTPPEALLHARRNPGMNFPPHKNKSSHRSDYP